MKQELDLSFIQENYRRLSDSEIIEIATVDGKGLAPAAQQVLQEELMRRNLNPDLKGAVAAQNTELSVEQIDAYCERIQNLECPQCRSSSSSLNGIVSAQVMSFIVITNYQKKLSIACESCLRKNLNSSLTTSLILGWWGLPWGIIRTIQAITINLKAKKSIQTDAPTDSLRAFVSMNVGLIELHKEDPAILQRIISPSS